MAARFAVAAGNWNDTATWSATSGGASGASFPVAGDTVTIDANSPGDVTVNVASAAASVTINNGARTLLCNAGLTLTGAMTLTAGTLNTNGQTQSWGSFDSTASNARTLTLGASAITMTGANFDIGSLAAAALLTVTTNTASISSAVNNAFFSLGDRDWTGLSITFTGSTNKTIVAAGAKITNLTRTGGASTTNTLNLSGPNGNFDMALTVTGTLTLGGNTTQGINRLRVFGGGSGTGTVALTVGAVVITGDVNFQDVGITYSGAASWTNAGSAYVGDVGGNGAVVVANRTTPATQTATGTSSFTWSTHGWTSRVPLPQDPVVVNNAFSAGQTITADMPNLGKDLAFGATGSPALNFTVAAQACGSFTLAAGMTMTGSAVTLVGYGTHTITTAAVSMANASLTLLGTGTWTLQDAYTHTGPFSASTGSTLVTGNFAMSVSTFTAAGTAGFGSTVTLGSSTISLTGTGTVWNRTTGTVNAGTSTIDITNTSATAKTFAGGGATYATVKHVATGSAQLTITGNNTFANLDLECTTARTIVLPASGTQTVTGSLKLLGASGQLLTVQSSSSGVASTITKGSGYVTVDYVALKDSTATGGAEFHAGSHSTNTSGNTGWSFTANPAEPAQKLQMVA